MGTDQVICDKLRRLLASDDLLNNTRRQEGKLQKVANIGKFDSVRGTKAKINILAKCGSKTYSIKIIIKSTRIGKILKMVAEIEAYG